MNKWNEQSVIDALVNGPAILSIKEIPHGKQFCLDNGAFVNLWINKGGLSFQGINQGVTMEIMKRHMESKEVLNEECTIKEKDYDVEEYNLKLILKSMNLIEAIENQSNDLQNHVKALKDFISEEDQLFWSDQQQIDNAAKLLPTWFVPRMMQDYWTFGLLLSTGDILAVATINEVSKGENGDVWINAELCEHTPFCKLGGKEAITSPTERVSISINASHVVAAMELADT